MVIPENILQLKESLLKEAFQKVLLILSIVLQEELFSTSSNPLLCVSFMRETPLAIMQLIPLFPVTRIFIRDSLITTTRPEQNITPYSLQQLNYHQSSSCIHPLPRVFADVLC